MCVRGAFGLFVLADRLARMGVTRGSLEPESHRARKSHRQHTDPVARRALGGCKPPRSVSYRCCFGCHSKTSLRKTERSGSHQSRPGCFWTKLEEVGLEPWATDVGPINGHVPFLFTDVLSSGVSPASYSIPKFLKLGQDCFRRWRDSRNDCETLPRFSCLSPSLCKVTDALRRQVPFSSTLVSRSPSANVLKLRATANELEHRLVTVSVLSLCTAFTPNEQTFT